MVLCLVDAKSLYIYVCNTYGVGCQLCRVLPKFWSRRRIKWSSRHAATFPPFRVGVQSMLSYMECYSSVTAASQSEPVSFAEHSSDVCNQIQAMVWRNSQRNFQVYSVKNISGHLGSLRKLYFRFQNDSSKMISECIYPRERRRRKWKSCYWMQNKVFIYFFIWI